MRHRRYGASASGPGRVEHLPRPLRADPGRRNGRSGPRGLFRPVTLGLLLLSCQGCCLQALWSDDGDGEERRVVSDVVARDVEMGWSLPDGDRRGASMLLMPVSAAEPSAGPWRLVPTRASEAALPLLNASDLLPDPKVTVRIDREREDGDLVVSEAELTIAGAIGWQQLGGRIDPATLPVETRERLRELQSPQFAYWATPTPDLLQRCDERLRRLDLAALSPQHGPMAIVGAVVVDAVGKPWMPPVLPAVPADGDDEAAIARQQAAAAAVPSEFELLQGVQAIVLAAAADGPLTLRVRMDLAWLAAELEPLSASSWQHRSEWVLADASAAPADRRGIAQVHLTEGQVRWVSGAVARDGLGMRIALTPLALLGDLTFGWLVKALGFCDDDDEDEEADDGALARQERRVKKQLRAQQARRRSQ